ncbi:hypothetical protein B0J18DRAFT_422933 [Chaetomium sp. MPI-SDFR-AT-0129]|nr:hypothetical protein B0J18DRAFT_422933 [Chaetomium sp. MPI-SDFR-AT-0129]
MRFTTRAVWSLVTSLAHLSANIHHAMVHAATSGLLEVDLVFPRDNQTYAPTPYMPIVFALHNAELARGIYPEIAFRIRNRLDPNEGQGEGFYLPINLPNETISNSEPWLVHTLVNNFATAGAWDLVFDLWWVDCKLEENFGDPEYQGRVAGHVLDGYPGAISMNTSHGGQGLDLVAATADEKACHAGMEPGHVLNVTNDRRNVTDYEDKRLYPTCLMVSKVAPDTSLHLCDVRINSTAATAIAASVKDALCHGKNPPADCPSEPSTASRLGVAGAGYLVATLATLGFLRFLA